MTAESSVDLSALEDLPRGSHVCWVYDDDATYVAFGAQLLRDAATTGEKPVVFGPDGSAIRDVLAPLAALAADPGLVVLGGGPLDPAAMFAMFHDQTERARDEGYTGIRLVADMDWLLPAAPTAADVVGFELLLDHHARELGATMICAYRRSSFESHLLTGACCVHPINVAADTEPQFRLTGADHSAWALSGELDIATVDHFTSAIGAIAAADPACVIDVSELDFIDVAAMASIARAAEDVPLRLTGAAPTFRRNWELAGFGTDAPQVTLTD